VGIVYGYSGQNKFYNILKQNYTEIRKGQDERDNIFFTAIGRVWRVEYDDNIDFCRGYNAATTFLNFQKRSLMYRKRDTLQTSYSLPTMAMISVI